MTHVYFVVIDLKYFNAVVNILIFGIADKYLLKYKLRQLKGKTSK